MCVCACHPERNFVELNGSIPHFLWISKAPAQHIKQRYSIIERHIGSYMGAPVFPLCNLRHPRDLKSTTSRSGTLLEPCISLYLVPNIYILYIYIPYIYTALEYSSTRTYVGLKLCFFDRLSFLCVWFIIRVIRHLFCFTAPPTTSIIEPLSPRPLSLSLGDEPSLDETMGVIKAMPNWRALGPDGLPAELLILDHSIPPKN